MNLADQIQIERPAAAAVVAQTAILGSAVDMEGFEGCVFVALLGAVSTDCVPTLSAQQATATGGSYAALLGTAVAGDDGDDDLVLVLDVYRPAEQFLKPNLTRAGGSTGCVVDGILAIKYGAGLRPTALGAAEVAREIHATPAEGAV